MVKPKTKRKSVKKRKKRVQDASGGLDAESRRRWKKGKRIKAYGAW